MLTTEKPLSRQSQLELATKAGESIVPKLKSRSRCPNCKKIGGIFTPTTMPVPDGRYREHGCKLCGHFFTTTMTLPDACDHCSSRSGYTCPKTLAVYGGVYRLYKCVTCKKYTKSYEQFPIPDDKRKRPIDWN